MGRILIILIIGLVAGLNILNSQNNDILKGRGPFSRKDSLRGVLNSFRACYDVIYYNLNLKVDIKGQSIQGFNDIVFKTLMPFSVIQIDLTRNFTVDSVIYNNKQLEIKWEEAAFFVLFGKTVPAGIRDTIRIYYQGKPRIAPKPPWDGGFIWAKDRNNNPWVGVACEGLGASHWWPSKDHLSDEPDSMQIAIAVPESLQCIANGHLKSIIYEPKGFARYVWQISYPINSYNVTLNIGDYVQFSDTLKSVAGILQLDYYVLRYNLEKAKKHFKQVKPMLRCFERLFGPYPFMKDGYALVETPYWGMEHQSAVAYGNNYENNEYGFDYIIIHETAHEWFGNNISCKDHGDLWIHEAFATYAEVLYLECTSSLSNAVEYLRPYRQNIRNIDAIQGPLNVNFHDYKYPDMYYKGAWMLHTLRQVIHHDSLWFAMLYDINKTFWHKTVSNKEFINYFTKFFKKDLDYFFDTYLNYINIPTLILKQTNQGVAYKWQVNSQKFVMPVDLLIKGRADKLRIYPNNDIVQYLEGYKLQEIKADLDNFLINVNYVE